MYAQAALAVLGLTSGAVATYSPGQLNNLRDLNAHGVEARQDDTTTSTDGPGLECTTSALKIMSSVPTPTGDLYSYFMTFGQTADVTDTAALCKITADIPQSLTSAYSSYDQAASSWYSANSQGLSDLLSSCVGGDVSGQITQVQSALDIYTAGGCSGSLSLPTTQTGSGSVSATASGSATASESAPASTTTGAGDGEDTDGADGAAESASSVPTGAAARPTGLVVGAAAAAGFLGVAMML